MPNENLRDIVESANARMQQLYQQAGSPPTHQHGLIPETFEELQIALEELEVASDELRQQNEVLIETQASLAEERYRYLELFNSAPEAYFVSDMKGVVREANRAASHLIGVSPQYLRGKPLANYVAEHDRAKFRSTLSSIHTAVEPQQLSLDMEPRNAPILPAALSASVIFTSKGDPTGIRWLIRDITTLREVEHERALYIQEQAARAEAERAHQYFAQIIDGITDPFYCMDDDWRITVANRRCLELWNKKREEVIGKTLWTLFPEVAESEVGNQIRRIVEEKKAGSFEAVSKVLGRWIEVHVYPGLESVSVYFHDIHDRKQKQDQSSREHAKDRRIAQALQKALLVMPVAEQYPYLELEAVYAPASDDAAVGGDYYDVFGLHGTQRVALVVGDVTGKGLSAATYTAQMKFALRSFLWETSSPGEALARLNDFICSSIIDPSEFIAKLVALTVVVFDRATGQAVIASAGGQPLVLIRADGTVELGDTRGMVIGVEAGQRYPETICAVEAGDVLLLSTDGIVEARSPDGEFLSLEGMIDIARSIRAQNSVQDMGSLLLQHAKEFAGGAMSDDVCILLARSNP